MVFRLCALLLAFFLVSCSGSSDPDATSIPKAAPVFPTTSGTFDVPYPSPAIALPIPVSSANYSVSFDEVSETPSSKAQTIRLNGNVIKFTATAGQLIAYQNPAWPTGPGEAVISYTAYTRDDLPRDTRPVTFVFNGGPGVSATALDLDFLGPKSFDPDVPFGNGIPLKDNANTLLDRSDLVFVDPVGTGYSAAIRPNKNLAYWGADSDAMVLRDFILRYINVNNCQSSPKYIYGVSYGGFRAPIIGRLLVESGTTQYVADPTNKPAKTLTGLVLNSPVLDMRTDCFRFWRSCAGNVPTYALVADYHRARRDNVNPPPLAEARLTELRAFAARFNNLYNKVFNGLARNIPDRTAWDAYLRTADGSDFVQKLAQLAGIGPGNDNAWIENPNMDALQFATNFDPDKGDLSLNDGREFLPRRTIDPSLDHTNVELGYIKIYQAQFMGYVSPPATPYMGDNGEAIAKWNYEPDSRIAMTDGKNRALNTMPDLALSLLSRENPKILIQHGYYDLNTPFHKSELDLRTAGIADRVAVSTYEGGHAIPPDTTSSYERVMLALRAFYDQPPRQLLAALNPVDFEGGKHE